MGRDITSLVLVKQGPKEEKTHFLLLEKSQSQKKIHLQPPISYDIRIWFQKFDKASKFSILY